MYKKILVAIDDSETSRSALKEALHIARTSNAKLYITHVAAQPSGDVTFPAIEPDIWRPVSGEAIAAEPDDSAATEFVVYERIQ